MTPARGRAWLMLAAAVAAVAILIGLLLVSREPPAPTPKPRLLLLTSLPLLFGEQFGIDTLGSPALEALDEHFDVLPIGTTSPRELERGRLLLMAQPPAQTAENLVALDAWVRSGGRVLVLADPVLEWPSEHAPGDPLRPSPMFADTGLLAHWGLRLDAPDERGRAERRLAGREVEAISPGTLHGRCAIGADRFVALCHIGSGWAKVVADADFLDARTAADPRQNFDALAASLAMLRKN